MSITKPLPVNIYFVWQWWEKYYQRFHERPSAINMNWLDETYKGRQRFLYDEFGQFGIGQENPVLDGNFVSKVMPFHTMIIAVALGMKVELQNVGGYTWKSMSKKQLKKLKPVNIADTIAGELILRQRQERVVRYGVATQMVDLASVSNNAFMLRGQEFYSDLMINKAFAHHYLEVITETMCMAYKFITDIFGPIEGFPLGNCNVTMMSPELYIEMIRPYDIRCVEYASQLTKKEPSCNLHHCNVKAEPFAEAYSRIPGLHCLQGSHLSDINKIQQMIPGVSFSAMLNPQDLLSKPTGQIETELNRCLAAGADDLAIWDIDPNYNLKRMGDLLYRIGKIAVNNDRKAEFTIIPITWEELDWEFPIYRKR
ncbi:MAG: uroporphyrinogen decarboxylase family protein [bacterium]|nr:uroporphyrinogen decarboxylase family protein [bacterium]